VTDPKRGSATTAFATVTVLFFLWGFATASIDPLVPSMKAVFNLTYAESMLTQFAFFLAYGVVSLPAAAILERMGYANTTLIALGTMLVGCLSVAAATHTGTYAYVLGGLFVIAAGIALLQVTANPLAALLGAPERSDFRLTVSQTFNSLGTVIAPFIGSYLVLSGGVFAAQTNAGSGAATLHNVDTQFLIIAGVLVLLGLFMWRQRHLLRIPVEAETAASSSLAAFTSRWALFGGLAIFLYVGAEVSIGSMMINFLHQPSILNVSYATAGQLLSLYWGGAMVGRAIGSGLLLRVPASRLLTINAIVALLLCLLITQEGGVITSLLGGMTAGHVAGVAAIVIGLFNSIMFPNIFSLTLKHSSANAPSTSGLLCTAIVGGAILPLLTGLAADRLGIAHAFFVPIVSYACIAGFALATGARERASIPQH
jgi:MFS transporter, FHS family, L-fucose permease